MKVCQVRQAAEPGYPEREDFARCRQWVGAAVMGAGVALSACETPTRTDGMPPRIMRDPGPVVGPAIPTHQIVGPTQPGLTNVLPPRLLGVPPLR